jgi:RHH-type rel operon transcriptional repressor/antitoxin RelB
MLALRLPPEIETRLDALAKRTGRTKSFYAREAILQHLAGFEAQADIERQALQADRDAFAEECRRQSRLLSSDPLERETLDWLQAASDTDGWA